MLTTHKGVAMMVLDKQDYMDKAKNLLQQPTYRSFPVYPTNKYKAKLINILKRIKKDHVLPIVSYLIEKKVSLSPKNNKVGKTKMCIHVVHMW